MRILAVLNILANLLNPTVHAQSVCTITVATDTQLSTANANVLPGQTVCLNSGTYNVAIIPTRSGTSDSNRIYYQASPGALVTLHNKIDLNSKSYVTVSNINIVTSSTAKYYADLANGSHITIDHVDMSSGAALTPGNPPITFNNTSYSVIRNSHIWGADDHYNDTISMLGNTHHNLIENNRFDEGSHTNILFQGDGNVTPTNPPRFNIIRNNHFLNLWHHCINAMYGTYGNVIEGNVFERCGAGTYAKDPLDTRTYIDGAGDQGDFHSWQSTTILRRNIIMNSGRKVTTDIGAAASGASSTYPTGNGDFLAVVKHNRIYNNVLYGNWGDGFHLGIYARATSDLTGYTDNKFVNNIFYNNGDNGTATKGQVSYIFSCDPAFTGTCTITYPSSEEWRNNIIGDAGDLAFKWKSTLYSITDSGLAANFAVFSGNKSGNPGFVFPSRDASVADFHLQTGSAAIEAGDFLTKTTQACSGNIVHVLDSGYFTDGLGIIAGDLIQFAGSTSLYSITSVDYATNTLTLASSAICANNTGVSLPYFGSKPDIGVYEYQSIAQMLQQWFAPYNSFDFARLWR